MHVSVHSFCLSMSILLAASGLSIETMKTKDVVDTQCGIAWHHGSCGPHCLTTNIVNENLSDAIHAEMFTDEVVFYSRKVYYIHQLPVRPLG